MRRFRDAAPDGSRGGAGKLERDLDAAGLLADRSEEGLAPVVERVAVGDEEAEVHLARGAEIDIVLDGVLAHAAELLDAEGVGADHAQLLEVQRRPLEALGRLDADDREDAARP